MESSSSGAKEIPTGHVVVRTSGSKSVKSSRLVDARRQALAGAAAGFIECCTMYPFDLVKTRFQIQRGANDPTRYTSILDCLKKMYTTEGVLSYYKGIVPPLLTEAPKRATKFLTFEQFHIMFKQADLPQPLLLGGLASGLVEGFLISPFERVKVYLQAQRHRMSQQPSTWSAVRTIVSQHGIGRHGLFKGMPATLCRHGLWNMLYFGTYHHIRKYIEAQGYSVSVVGKFTLGLTAGLLATTSNLPFDVAKSRIQGPPPPHNPEKYHYTLRTIMTVFHEEGFCALYKGLVPKLIKLGPGGAIMFVVYEQVSLWLMNFN